MLSRTSRISRKAREDHFRREATDFALRHVYGGQARFDDCSHWRIIESHHCNVPWHL